MTLYFFNKKDETFRNPLSKDYNIENDLIMSEIGFERWVKSYNSTIFFKSNPVYNQQINTIVELYDNYNFKLTMPFISTPDYIKNQILERARNYNFDLNNFNPIEGFISIFLLKEMLQNILDNLKSKNVKLQYYLVKAELKNIFNSYLIFPNEKWINNFFIDLNNLNFGVKNDISSNSYELYNLYIPNDQFSESYIIPYSVLFYIVLPSFGVSFQDLTTYVNFFEDIMKKFNPSNSCNFEINSTDLFEQFYKNIL